MNNEREITDAAEKEMAGAELQTCDIYRSHLSAYASYIDNDCDDDEDDEYYSGDV